MLTKEDIEQWEEQWNQGIIPPIVEQYNTKGPTGHDQIDLLCAYSQWYSKAMASYLWKLYEAHRVVAEGPLSHSIEQITEAMQFQKEFYEFTKAYAKA